jgi:hypothetical protein
MLQAVREARGVTMIDESTLTFDAILERLDGIGNPPRLILLTSPLMLKVILERVKAVYEGAAWAEHETGTNAEGKTEHRWRVGHVWVYTSPRIMGVYQVTNEKMIEALEGPFWVRERGW